MIFGSNVDIDPAILKQRIRNKKKGIYTPPNDKCPVSAMPETNE
jgi:hypothetical protein